MNSRKLVCIVVCICMMITLGCAAQVSPEQLAEKALKDEYDKSFEVDTVLKDGNILDLLSGDDSVTMIAHAINSDCEAFKVSIYSDGTFCSANYRNIQFCEQIAECVRDNFYREYTADELYVRVITTVYAPDSDDIDTVDRFIEEYGDTIRVYLYFNDEDSARCVSYEEIACIFDGFDEFNTSDKYYVTFIADCNPVELKQYFRRYDVIYDDFKYLEGETVGNVVFSYGEIQTTREEFISIFES